MNFQPHIPQMSFLLPLLVSVIALLLIPVVDADLDEKEILGDGVNKSIEDAVAEVLCK